MGQQQQQTTRVAAVEEKGGGTLLRRMILLVAVTALVAAMLAVSALPAMAKNSGPQAPGPPVFSGSDNTLVTHCQALGGKGANASSNGGDHGSCRFD